MCVSRDQRTDVRSKQANELSHHIYGKCRAEKSDDDGTTDGDEDPPTSDFYESAPSAPSSVVSVDDNDDDADDIKPPNRKRKRDSSVDPPNERNVNRKLLGTHTKSYRQELSDDAEGAHQEGILNLSILTAGSADEKPVTGLVAITAVIRPEQAGQLRHRGRSGMKRTTRRRSSTRRRPKSGKQRPTEWILMLSLTKVTPKEFFTADVRDGYLVKSLATQQGLRSMSSLVQRNRFRQEVC